ncbi:Coenzyme Q-binding protein coq10, mitochondrial [Rhizina undulata]
MPPRILLPGFTPSIRLQFASQRRHFFDLPHIASPQRFKATRTLPHSSKILYNLVADIDSYHRFLPYCLGSTVTKFTASGTPSEADLRVGWGNFDETFSSKVVCRPEENIVEADASNNALFERLNTRWEIVDKGNETRKESDVSLHIEFKFVNPLYSAVSQAVGPKVANLMIEAFEKRVREVLGKEEPVVKEVEKEEVAGVQ